MQNLGATTAATAVAGLGWNVTDTNADEFAAAQAAGASYVRFQCPWANVESQTAPPSNTNTGTQFALTSACTTGLANASTYSLHPLLIAAYGPPFHQILSVYAPNGAALNATSFEIQFASGVGGDTLSSITYPLSYIIGSGAGYQWLTPAHGYAGTLITSITPIDSTHATVHLASGLWNALPANTTTTYTINQALYSPALTANATDTTNVAYQKYAQYLGSQILASSLTGSVELWNEPPWPDDSSDNLQDFYDTDPGISGEQVRYAANYGFIAALQANATTTTGLRYTWAGTNKSGASDILSVMGSGFTQANGLIGAESLHPYGHNPEDNYWNGVCLAATINTYPTAPSNGSGCSLESFSSENMYIAKQQSLYQRSHLSTWGYDVDITETGCDIANCADNAHIARYVTRQFLAAQAEGVSPVMFYTMYDPSGAGYSFITPGSGTSYTPLPQYTAISGLMADLATIKYAPPVAYTLSSLASVTSYSGTYPLNVAHLVGARFNDTANSDLMTVWQMSNTGNTSGNWGALATPAAATTVIALPAGTQAAKVVDVATQTPVSFTQSGQNITLAVADDPVEILVQHAPVTWYVRADGGSRYDSNVTTGQCNGLADAAYPGSGVNQNCAFGDFRYLWDDTSYGGYNNWAISGGDTVIVDNTKQWRVGFDGNGTSTDKWCFGGTGFIYCYNPPIPAGTSNQHTRILGRNWANCNNGNATNRSQLTYLYGGSDVLTVLNLGGAQYVDVQCFEITDHSNCIKHGAAGLPQNCPTSAPVLDNADYGAALSNTAHDVLLQDLYIHGVTTSGVDGPIGGTITANRVGIYYTGLSGWDFDDHSGSNPPTPSLNNPTLVGHYVTIEWAGCNEEYPDVDPIPITYCYTQSAGGNGDGMGTPAEYYLSVLLDHAIVAYSMQDGLDIGHIDTQPPSGINTFSVTDSILWANAGSNYKIGPAFNSQTLQNDLSLGNCYRTMLPITGVPSTYNTYNLDPCRADPNDVSFNFQNGQTQTANFQNNSFITYMPSIFNFQCDGASNCAGVTFNLQNNIVVGYDNPNTYSYGGQAGGPGLFCGPACNGNPGLIETFARSNNIWYGIKSTCPANTSDGSAVTETAVNESCSNVLYATQPSGNAGSFVESELDAIANTATTSGVGFNLSASSPAIHAGVAISGLTTDFNGRLYHNPPTEGAIEFYPANTLTSGAVKISGAALVH